MIYIYIYIYTPCRGPQSIELSCYAAAANSTYEHEEKGRIYIYIHTLYIYMIYTPYQTRNFEFRLDEICQLGVPDVCSQNVVKQMISLLWGMVSIRRISGLLWGQWGIVSSLLVIQIKMATVCGRISHYQLALPRVNVDVFPSFPFSATFSIVVFHRLPIFSQEP